MDFILLTGFLGSGKTTLIADFLKRPEAADTAVIVNEVGEIGLDGAILAESTDIPIAMLSNGCLCCSLAGDLEQTVEAVVDARRDGPPLARIILETSGVSKPGPILRSLAGLAPLRLRVGVVATVDCRAAAATAGFEEAAAQWASAQTLVFTKCDIASAAEHRQAREVAIGINPVAELIDTEDRDAAVGAAFTFRQGGAAVSPLPSGLAHPRMQALLARPDGTISWDELAEWLDNLAGLCGERLLRVKGVVRLADRAQPVLVQSVGTLFSAPRPFRELGGEPSFLVVIVRDTDPAELAGVLPSLPLSFTRLGRA
ncbi:MAG: GTP-binding protein [Alphaproteobacteria bacterium]|nr:GTP-binding protein [Alphaproteobacteria bacterium]